MREILALVDDLIYAQSVGAQAAWFSAETGAAVQLLHVVDYRQATAGNLAWAGGMAVGSGPGMIGEAARAAEENQGARASRGAELLEQTRHMMLEYGAVSVEHRLVEGRFDDVVVRAARSARLLVMGKRGVRADFARLPLGSNVYRVARSIPVPMVLAARAFRVPTNWMLAFAPTSELAAGIERITAGDLLPFLPCDLVHAGVAEDRIRSQVIEAQSCLAEAGFVTRTAIYEGMPAKVLPEHAVRQGIDMIALGGLRKSLFLSTLFGSTAEDLVRGCQVPALLLR